MLASTQTLASVIRQLRLKRGTTQEELAFDSNVTVSALSRIERGLSSPVFTTLVKLADALDVTPAELVAAAEEVGAPRSDKDA
ncbi:MAG TPA: helix-turn-helix transcriptional regulator [Solirubrobacteraceae bacterium]